MENKEIEVTGCEDCILYKDLDFGDGWCYHPNHPNKIGVLNPFEDCPLKQHSLTIKLKQDAE